MRSLFIIFLLGFFLNACGEMATSLEESINSESKNLPYNPNNPFYGLERGDDFEWATFIRETYLTEEVAELPMLVYPAFFTNSELEIVKEAIDYANSAIGFEVFEIVDEWAWDARPIYKVSEISFDESATTTGITDSEATVGYTYSRNLYPWGKSEAARVVTDWAIEIREDRVNKWVIAHELGHAMGMVQHALIDYDTGKLLELEKNSLMEASINYDPALEDYEYMMQMQGELLLDYLEI